jgi:hypothetical protein
MFYLMYNILYYRNITYLVYLLYTYMFNRKHGVF